MKVGFVVLALMISMLYVNASKQVNAAGNWLKKGLELTANRSYEDAITAYDIAIQMNPENAEAWHYIGEAFEAIGRTTEAEEAFESAKELGYQC